MENNTERDILKTCKKIFKKQGIPQLKTTEEHIAFIKDHKEENNEFIIHNKSGLSYRNNKENIGIHLYHSICNRKFESEQDFSKSKLGEIIEKKGDFTYTIKHQPGDIYIDTTENASISENLKSKDGGILSGAFMFGESCFTQEAFPQKRHDLISLLPATQSDLIAILEALKKLT